MNCINRNLPEFKNLQKELGVSNFEAEAIVANWQEDNGLDRFPTLEEALNWATETKEFQQESKSLPNQSRGQKDLEIRAKYFTSGDTTAKGILKDIEKSNHPLNKLAGYLLSKVTKGQDVKVALVADIPFVNGGFPAAVYEYNSDYSYKIIKIKEDAKFRGKGSEPTIIHEILHAMTVEKLSKGNDKFNSLYEYAKSQIGTSDYAMSNKEEFIVGVFTDGKFIQKLQSIPASKNIEFNNFWEELLDYFLSLFKITKGNSLYEQAFAVATEVIEQNEANDPYGNILTNLDEISIEDYTFDEMSFDEAGEEYKNCSL